MRSTLGKRVAAAEKHEVPPGATSYVKIGRGVMHEIYWDFANSGRVRLKFGHTKLGREIKTGKLMFSRGNNPLHTHMAATCSKAAGFNLNTSHFVFSNQAYMYIY